MDKLLLLATALIEPIGIVLAVIGAIILIVSLIKKKPKYVAPIILIVLGVALIFASTPIIKYAFSSYIANQQQGRNEKYLEKEQYAKTDDKGNIYFQINKFSAVDDNGNVFDNDTLAKYKYTFVNVWEPWCGPCKDEMDDLEKLYEKYKDKGINFVGFYTNEKDAETVKAEHNLTYPTVRLSEEEYANILNTFLVGNIPLSFVLDSEGKLVYTNTENPDIDKNDTSAPAYYTQFANSVTAGARSYDFWDTRLDSLLK